MKIPLIRSYTIKISLILIPEVWYILHIEDNSELLSSSSRKATACNTLVPEQQKEKYLILSCKTYKIL